MTAEKFQKQSAHNLAISSIVLGLCGATGFIAYKWFGLSKNSLVGHGSKLLIAIGILLLAIAVLTLSRNTEAYLHTIGIKREQKDRMEKRRHGD